MNHISYDPRCVVERHDDAYTARFVEPDEGESAPFLLVLPFSERGKEELRWYLEDYPQFVGTGDRVLAAEIEERISQGGRALYGVLFKNDVGARLYQRLMGAARAGQSAILTLSTDLPEGPPPALGNDVRPG